MTTYCERVEAVVEVIPAGTVVTYGDVAELIGSGAARAVGMAMSRSLGLPWWRVVRADGGLHAALLGDAVERWTAEGIAHDGHRVDLARHRLGDAGLLALLPSVP